MSELAAREMVLTVCGKPATECTKEELIRALEIAIARYNRADEKLSLALEIGFARGKR